MNHQIIQKSQDLQEKCSRLQKDAQVLRGHSTVLFDAGKKLISQKIHRSAMKPLPGKTIHRALSLMNRERSKLIVVKPNKF